MTSSLACIVLAAGSSKRFGNDKRLVKNANGQTLLDLTLSSIPLVFKQHILVLHPGDDAIATAYQTRWQIVYAEFAEHGMGNSIAAAVKHISDCTGVLIALADMPLVAQATFTLLAETARPDRIIVPFFNQQRGNPVVIGKNFLPKLAELNGDSGARQLMQQHPELVVRVDLGDPGVLRDIDTPTELQTLPGFGKLHHLDVAKRDVKD
jgi:molybdenum cofactor cytidylyltransferase